MKVMISNVLMVLALFTFVGCQSDEVQELTEVEVFDQLDARASAEYYLNAMFIENDLDALKAMTHPDQKADFSKSIGSLATMLVRMDFASYDITFFEQKEDQAIIKFDLQMTSKGEMDERKEIMTLIQIDGKWYIQ